jgi:hypothetical protein
MTAVENAARNIKIKINSWNANDEEKYHEAR